MHRPECIGKVSVVCTDGRAGPDQEAMDGGLGAVPQGCWGLGAVCRAEAWAEWRSRQLAQVYA